MRDSGWRLRLVRRLIRFDRYLNQHTAWIPMPGGYALGSGKDETYCAHWHAVPTWWARAFCRVLDRIDCDHCKKSAHHYRGKGRWLLGPQ
jgi:hypothetical protein